MTEPGRRQKVLYYTLGITPPAASREWVERDVHSIGWRLRRGAQLWIGTLMGAGLVIWLADDSSAVPAAIGAAIGGLIAAILQGTVMAGYLRRRQIDYHRKRWERRARQA